MKQPVTQTMTPQGVMLIKGRGHCVHCNALAPYHIRFERFLQGAYCWRHIPRGYVDLVKKITRELRQNKDAMLRIYNAGHAPENPHATKVRGFTSRERRYLRRWRKHPLDVTEEELRSAKISGRAIREWQQLTQLPENMQKYPERFTVGEITAEFQDRPDLMNQILARRRARTGLDPERIQAEEDLPYDEDDEDDDDEEEEDEDE